MFLFFFFSVLLSLVFISKPDSKGLKHKRKSTKTGKLLTKQVTLPNAARPGFRRRAGFFFPSVLIEGRTVNFIPAVMPLTLVPIEHKLLLYLLLSSLIPVPLW